MSTETAAQLEAAVTASLPRDRRPTEEEVSERAQRMRSVFDVTDEEFERSLRALHARLALEMDMGTALVTPDHVPWLLARKASLKNHYWSRYDLLLAREGRSRWILNVLDGVTDEILDFAGDPERPGEWARRGLVMGDVQSGKTGTYTGLICKAADAGYGVMILLTGSLENLRRQTQERLDLGFVGFDSAERLKTQVQTSRLIGVGLIDQTRMGMVFTSRSRDFNKALMNQLNLRLASMKDPVLLVVKKNKRVLENLEEWLRSFNAGADSRIDQPVLLIDDEADAGSVNTAAGEDNPTKVNQAIRKLLRLFKRSSYVGFTATPFANVFIDPDTKAGMLGDDLFPADFIYALEAPNNYFGPSVVLDVEGNTIEHIEDAEPFFPTGHKSGHVVTGIPASLYEAVRSFLIATTIRDIRAQEPPHRSMLVNLSPWTAVQEQVVRYLDAYVRDVQRDIRNYAALGDQGVAESAALTDLRSTWRALHDDGSLSWADIQRNLLDAVQPIVVRAVNQNTGAASLDYRDQGEKGLRVIAVGGNSLSRGLTLEGLTTSYFYRNSQAYDTLMQMGRWFGYRDGYDDVCRVWMTEESQGNYAYIARAIDELRNELKRMKRVGATPREFGLRVRSHPGALVVTARNKMRRANEIAFEMSLSKELLETARLRSSPQVISANRDVVGNWLDSLHKVAGPAVPSRYGMLGWDAIASSTIADLLAAFQTHPLNHDFQADALAEFIRSTDEPKLSHWDVRIPAGAGPEEIGLGQYIRLKPRIRRVVEKEATASILVSGSSARVGSPEDEREGLTERQVEDARAESAGKTVSGDLYRRRRSRPLLIINALDPMKATGSGRRDITPLAPDKRPLLALGISFPEFDDSEVKDRVIYKVNEVLWRSLFEQETGDDFGLDDDAD